MCTGCGRSFCLEHRTSVSHACPSPSQLSDSSVIVCPLCALSVRVASGDAQATFDQHTRDGSCQPALFGSRTTKLRCPVPRCREKLVFSNRVTCKACRGDFCLKHRHAADHACAPLPPPPRILPKTGPTPVRRQPAAPRAASGPPDPSNTLRGTAGRRGGPAAAIPAAASPWSDALTVHAHFSTRSSWWPTRRRAGLLPAPRHR